MKILVACEFSGQVRRAFEARGHTVWSCDFIPAEDGSKFHYQGDVRDMLHQEWDMMIAHPPCQYLCNSGVRWLSTRPDRWPLMEQAAYFFKRLHQTPIPKVAIENPVMHKHAMAIIGVKPSFTLQPWQHGEPETKRTCFWTRGLPPITPTNIVEGRKPRVHYASPGPDRWKERSRTLPGVARALAEQWG